MSPLVQPVYLAVPSRSLHDTPVQPFFAEFTDRLARNAVTAERVWLSVVEYCDFVHELAPLGAPFADIARQRVSGFRGTDYRALFDGMRQLLDYDRYRLAGPRTRLGRPFILVIAERAPRLDDHWPEAHARLLRAVAPQMRVLATTRAASGFAQRTSFPPPPRPGITPVTSLAAYAADLVGGVIDHRSREIGFPINSDVTHRKVSPR